MRRPATSFLVGLLTILLLPFLVLLLTVTGVGLIVVPFVVAAVFIAAIVGKVSLLEWIGFKIGRQFGNETLQKPVLALVMGTVIILLLYLVPVLGLATFALTRVWGLGAAVLAGLSRLRREIPEKPAGPGLAPVPAPATPQSAPFATEAMAAAAVGPSMAESPSGASSATSFPSARRSPTTAPGSASVPSALNVPPLVPETLAHPRAGFWERMGAGFLDAVLICVLGAWVGPFAPVVALAYFAGMWAWKQTTVGGIVRWAEGGSAGRGTHHLRHRAGARLGGRLLHFRAVPRLSLDRIGQGQARMAR